jgi:hypothetical protein
MMYYNNKIKDKEKNQVLVHLLKKKEILLKVLYIVKLKLKVIN